MTTKDITGIIVVAADTTGSLNYIELSEQDSRDIFDLIVRRMLDRGEAMKLYPVDLTEIQAINKAN